LRWSTHKENVADDRRGEDNHNAKLTEEQVLEIRKLATYMTRNDIARTYSVVPETIDAIIHRRSWCWLEEPSDAELIFATTRPQMKDLFA
jgi:hypothetical protein